MDIKRAIKAQGITMEETAKRMGISRITLSQTISRNPTISTLQRIANAAGCRVIDFFLDEQEAASSSSGSTLICPKCGARLNVKLTEEEEQL